MPGGTVCNIEEYFFSSSVKLRRQLLHMSVVSCLFGFCANHYGDALVFVLLSHIYPHKCGKVLPAPVFNRQWKDNATEIDTERKFLQETQSAWSMQVKEF